MGLSIGIRIGDSVTVYGYGETGKGNGKIPEAHTLYVIGSITKTMTAALAADFSLSKSSGLPRIPGDMAEGYDPEKPYRHYDKQKVYAYLKPGILESIPGKAFSYSNLGMALVGLPLGMQDAKATAANRKKGNIVTHLTE